MSHFYELSVQARSPVSLKQVRTFLKDPDSCDNDLLANILAACTQWGESYTGRDFRIKTWVLWLDAFIDRIQINRSPVDAVVTVEHLVSNVLTTVANSVYYLKKSELFSHILLVDKQTWPSNTDKREQSIKITFTTSAFNRLEIINEAIMRHAAYMYENRGDCDEPGKCAGPCGTKLIYDQFRIPRF